ncbi:MAG: prolipoprotein diacylglyceryl transferase [Deltaproteobacteria bacterium]|nr:prolipoprotein diacylglyceryl transferase [Deltaproteobacteria bacterium]
MHPNLFSIGPFSLHTYGLLIAIGFVSGLIVAIRIGKRHGIDSQHIMDMSLLLIISGIIGSRIIYVLMNASYYLENPLDIFKIWQGGLVFSGGLLGAVIAGWFYIRRHGFNIWQIGDIYAPAIAIAQSIGRIGCFMAGCCYGRPTSVSWGVTFTNPDSIAPLNIPLHPTQLYSSFSNLIIFIIVMILGSRKKFDGQVFIWYLILHSTARLLIERFRGDDRGMFPGTGWSMTQFITILILFSAISALFYLKSRYNKR